MEPVAASEDIPILFYIGQHETRRGLPVSDSLVQEAQRYGYDMLTTPITTSHFHSRILSILSSHQASSLSSNAPYPLIPPLTSTDTTLTPGESIPHLMGVSSEWIDLSSPDPLISSLSRQVLNIEVAYASFCGFSNIIIPGPKLHPKAQNDGLAQYARAIQEALHIGTYVSLSIMLPFTDIEGADSEEPFGTLASFARKEYVSGREGQHTVRGGLFGSWEAWHMIRTVCKYNQRLHVALSIPRQLPPMPVQNRWFAEPLRLLSFPSASFLKNQGGYPVLSKSHQALIFRYMRLRSPPWIFLSDVGPIPGIEESMASILAADRFSSPGMIASADASDNSRSPTPAEAAARQGQGESKKRRRDPTPHLSYIRYLQRNQPPRSVVERFGSGYQDYLQSPLQPLTDNLESITYEVFEKDPVKYNLYERAITAALQDWIALGKPGSGPDSRIVVAVVGAGRGPLVTRAWRATVAAEANIELWAVEKNPSAYVLLQKHNQDTWGGQVRVVKADMRSWKGPRRVLDQERDDAMPEYGKVDILISELLGSFGDNELSPECLDGAQNLLNPDYGISIPASYTAHLTPIATPRLHADIRLRSDADPNAPETPYVVMLHAFANLSTTTTSSPTDLSPVIHEAWGFSHPTPPAPFTITQLRREDGLDGAAGGQIFHSNGDNDHNARFARLNFPCAWRGACDGLAGYFEATLYADIELSTKPDQMQRKSPDMTSWFPIFFPLKTPLYFPDHSELEVNIWRQTDDHKVWYEWLVEAYAVVGGGGHHHHAEGGAAGGERIRLGSSELHSSVKNGCLM